MKSDFKLPLNETTTSPKFPKFQTWHELVKYVQNIPYGRNANRSDFGLVITENKGTCSSKHALLKSIADENNIDNVKLILCIFKMNAKSTPGIGNALENTGLEYIPEAHNYLQIGDKNVDVTFPNSDFNKLKPYILESFEIQPKQVISFKENYQRAFIKKWIMEKDIPLSLEQVWAIREKCILSFVNTNVSKKI